MAKMSKPQVKKAHRIARAIIRKGGSKGNPWAIGSAVAQGTAKRRTKRKR